MTKLSVNVNKLATLRNSRGKNSPDVVGLSAEILKFGAHGITIHPRPDGRHIRKSDILPLAELVKAARPELSSPIEFNIEGYPSLDFVQMVTTIRPDQCTLVPDPPEALTSNAGWDAVKSRGFLTDVLTQLRSAGVRTSLFMDPNDCNPAQLEALAQLQPDRVELYTEAYADAFDSESRERVTGLYAQAAERIHSLGIGLNAGHDLNQRNLGFLIERIPQLQEVSIGHALICEALTQGLQATVDAYLRILKWRT